MVKFAIQVVYALPEQILIVDCEVPAGTTVEQAIHLSGLAQKVPDLRLEEGWVGIYSKKIPLNHVLSVGDRIECYRSVSADPKIVRQKRVQKKLKSHKNL